MGIVPTFSSVSSQVFVVDDDPTIHDVLTDAFNAYGLHVLGFSDGDSFLSEATLRPPACVLLDVNMPGRSGLDVLKALDAQKYAAPILMFSASTEVPIVVEAMRNGALDFVQKPFSVDVVVDRVRQTLAVWRRLELTQVNLVRRSTAYDLLTPREKEVLGQIVQGASNKEVGRNLNISTRTAEVHRARIMEKLTARNTADLMRIVLTQERAH